MVSFPVMYNGLGDLLELVALWIIHMLPTVIGIC